MALRCTGSEPFIHVWTTSTALPSDCGSRVRTRTTIRTRSARKRSFERSNGRPSSDQAVRAIDTSGEPARTSRTRASAAVAPAPPPRRPAPPPPLRGPARPRAVARLEQLVQRPGERAVERAGEAVGGEAG